MLVPNVYVRLQPRPLLLAAVLLGIGCGGGGAATSPDKPQSTSQPILASVSIDPAASSIAIGGSIQVSAVSLDARGVELANAPSPAFTSSDPLKASVDAAGVVTGVAEGTAIIAASVTIQGVTRTANSTVTVTSSAPPAPPTPPAPPIPPGPPSPPAPPPPPPPAITNAIVKTPGRVFSPQTVTISVNGTVQWQITDERHNVTFTGATPPGGSIPDSRDASVTRVFLTEGKYGYECTRHRDKGMIGTVIVQAQQQQLQTFSAVALTPASGDLAIGGQIQISATPVDQNGFAIPGAPPSAFTSSASGIASVSPSGLVTGISTGTATISATLTIAGVSRTSAAVFTVTQTSAPLPPPSPPPPPGTSATVTTPGVSFSPQTVTIPANGSVTWQISGATHNVTFSGTAPPSGNIPDTRDASVARSFPVAGSYSYQCTRHSGMTGRVIVQ